MADVFLSYARANADAAQRVAAGLSRHGFSVWFDENLPAHRAYSEVIEEQLDAAAAVVVLWSRESVQSQWVRSEANRAREGGRLVQVRLDEARLPMPFDQIQCADLRKLSDWNSPAWRSLVESVAALVGRESSRCSEAAARGAPFEVDRRELLIAGGVVAAATAMGTGFLVLRGPDEPQLSSQAKLLISKGLDALQENDALDPQGTGSSMEAIALLKDATEAAPQSATAWGGLSMAYAVRKQVAPAAERPGLDSRSRSAATRALALDANESRALGALRLLEPVYRNWLAAERGDREALQKNPRLPILLFIMSSMLGSVGRWSDAVEFSKRFDRTKFLIPGADRKVVMDYWAAGDLSAADTALEIATEHWPQHPQIWRTRLAYTTYSGRPDETLALLQQRSERPPELTDQYFACVEATAQALAGRRAPADAAAQALNALRESPSLALEVAQSCAALNQPSATFKLLDGYYFGEGEWAGIAPAAGDQDRQTSPLFQPPMRRIWRDPRFSRLTQRIGLDDYWRKSGTLPDYKRLA